MAADAYSQNPSPDSEDDKDIVIGCMKAFLPYIRSEDVEEGDSYEVCVDREIEASLLAAISAPQDGYVSAVSLARIKSESSTDESIQQLIKLILDGFPKTKEELPDRMKCSPTPTHFRAYWRKTVFDAGVCTFAACEVRNLLRQHLFSR